jgi:hypothetical protein
MRDRFAFFSRRERGAPDHTPGTESAITRRPKPTAGAATPNRPGRPRDLDMRMRVPVRRVWLTALTSAVLAAIATLFFSGTTWNRAAIVSFLAAEGLFFCLGFYWMARATHYESMSIGLGGFVTLLPVGFVAFVTMQATAWVGHTHRVVSFRVVDDKDGTPIPGASVRLTLGFHGDVPEVKTNTAGEVDVECDFQTCGTNSFFKRQAVIEVCLTNIEVQAEGYHRVFNNLGDFTAWSWDLDGPPIPPIEIRLQRK